jgi:hypothetical protein
VVRSDSSLEQRGFELQVSLGLGRPFEIVRFRQARAMNHIAEGFSVRLFF